MYLYSQIPTNRLGPFNMELMSIEDLAEYLGDSKRTIYKYIKEETGPPYIRITSKNIKFDRADVDRWLESKKVYFDDSQRPPTTDNDGEPPATTSEPKEQS